METICYAPVLCGFLVGNFSFWLIPHHLYSIKGPNEKVLPIPIVFSVVGWTYGKRPNLYRYRLLSQTMANHKEHSYIVQCKIKRISCAYFISYCFLMNKSTLIFQDINVNVFYVDMPSVHKRCEFRNCVGMLYP